MPDVVHFITSKHRYWRDNENRKDDEWWTDVVLRNNRSIEIKNLFNSNTAIVNPDVHHAPIEFHVQCCSVQFLPNNVIKFYDFNGANYIELNNYYGDFD